MKLQEPQKKTVATGKRCGGHFTYTMEGTDFDCDYEPDFDCDECVFVVGHETGDYRKGKRPWAKGGSR